MLLKFYSLLRIRILKRKLLKNSKLSKGQPKLKRKKNQQGQADIESETSDETESDGEPEGDQTQNQVALSNKKKCFICKVNFDGRKKGAKSWMSCEKSSCPNWFCDICAKKISLNDSFICENCKK